MSSAANAALPQLAALPPAQIFEAVDDILCSGCPEALGPLLADGTLAHFGLLAPHGCLHALAQAPQNRCARWWLLLRACGTQPAALCAALPVPPALACGLRVYQAQFAAAPPCDMLALKRLLGRLPKFNYEAMAQAFALQNKAWQGQTQLYAALLASGEPYRMEQLAVSPALLGVEGVRRRKANAVCRALLKAVQRAPALNTYPVLVQMARALQQLV